MPEEGGRDVPAVPTSCRSSLLRHLLDAPELSHARRPLNGGQDWLLRASVWTWGVAEILNLQEKAGKAKPYQVKQVRTVLVRYKLIGEP